MTRADLRFSAALHQRALPHGFFADLGPGYLRLYHRSFVASPFASALVAEAGGQPVGFLLGILDTARHRRFAVRRMGVALAARGAVALSIRPRLAGWFVRNRLWRYARRLTRAVAPPAGNGGATPGGRTAVVMHVATDEAARGEGGGTALLEVFIAGAEHAGATRLELVTRSGEDGAGAFYERVGWMPTGRRHVRDGTTFESYELKLK